jgi:hypothetical protein
MPPYVRTVKTASGATAVQIVYRKRGRSREIVHVGSAHDDVELGALRRLAEERLHEGQEPLDFGVDGSQAGGFPIVSSRAARLWDALEEAWRRLGFSQAVRDDAFRKLVLVRVVEPASKRDSLRVLKELGVPGPSYRTVENCLDRCQQRGYRAAFEVACARHVDLSTLRLCLYDVTTLYWETDRADEFRIPGFSKERRLEPQITVGLLTDSAGFPLMVRAFEGNKAETKTIIPVLDAFRQANRLVDVTVVADAGMISEKNMCALEDAGYKFIVGGRIPREPGIVQAWRHFNPGQELEDGQVFCVPKTGTHKHPRRWMEWYQYREERAQRNEYAIKESVRKAEKIIAGQASAKKNRFLKDSGGTLELDQDLVDSARRRAGIRSYVTNLDADAEFIISTYHQLYQIEASFRLSKHDLAARPAFHWRRERIEAHLTIVFAALALSRWLEQTTGLSVKAFVNTIRPIRQVVLNVNGIPVPGEDTINDTARAALTAIHAPRGTKPA